MGSLFDPQVVIVPLVIQACSYCLLFNDIVSTVDVKKRKLTKMLTIGYDIRTFRNVIFKMLCRYLHSEAEENHVKSQSLEQITKSDTSSDISGSSSPPKVFSISLKTIKVTFKKNSKKIPLCSLLDSFLYFEIGFLYSLIL